MEKINRLSLLIGIVVGMALGVLVGYGIFSEKGDYSTAAAKVVNYLNENFLKPQGAEIRGYYAEPYGKHLIEINFDIYQNNEKIDSASVIATKDGEFIVFQIINTSEPVQHPLDEETGEEFERVNVSVDDDPYIGNPNAKVVIVEFSDFQCPYCRKFAIETLPKIIENYGDKIMFVYRDFPLEIHKLAFNASIAANCAREQGKFWEYHDILFERQAEWSNNASMFIKYAAELKLDVEAFKACLESGRYNEEIEKDFLDGLHAGVEGTPTFFINGRKVVGAAPYEVFVRIIEEELSEK